MGPVERFERPSTTRWRPRRSMLMPAPERAGHERSCRVARAVVSWMRGFAGLTVPALALGPTRFGEPRRSGHGLACGARLA
jgi:hypothetical protein